MLASQSIWQYLCYHFENSYKVHAIWYVWIYLGYFCLETNMRPRVSSITVELSTLFLQHSAQLFFVNVSFFIGENTFVGKFLLMTWKPNTQSQTLKLTSNKSKLFISSMSENTLRILIKVLLFVFLETCYIYLDCLFKIKKWK